MSLILLIKLNCIHIYLLMMIERGAQWFMWPYHTDTSEKMLQAEAARGSVTSDTRPAISGVRPGWVRPLGGAGLVSTECCISCRYHDMKKLSALLAFCGAIHRSLVDFITMASNTDFAVFVDVSTSSCTNSHDAGNLIHHDAHVTSV